MDARPHDPIDDFTRTAAALECARSLKRLFPGEEPETQLDWLSVDRIELVLRRRLRWLSAEIARTAPALRGSTANA